MPDRQLLHILLGRSRCGRELDLDPVCNLIWERQQPIALWKCNAQQDEPLAEDDWHDQRCELDDMIAATEAISLLGLIAQIRLFTDEVRPDADRDLQAKLVGTSVRALPRLVSEGQRGPG
jgi:hypothetical protein